MAQLRHIAEVGLISREFTMRRLDIATMLTLKSCGDCETFLGGVYRRHRFPFIKCDFSKNSTILGAKKKFKKKNIK